MKLVQYLLDMASPLFGTGMLSILSDAGIFCAVATALDYVASLFKLELKL